MHPYINVFGLFKIPSYGLMMATALITAILICYFRVKKAKLDLDVFSNLAIITIACGLLSAYLLYIFVTYPIKEIFESIKSGSFSVFKDAGLVFYGSIIGGVLSGLIYLKIKKQNFFDYAACIIPAIPLAHAIGRIGCFLAGCCYGQYCDTFLSVCYPPEVLSDVKVGVPVFPIQLVESLCNVLVFVILILYTRKNLKKRSVLFLYMLLYGIERFTLEFFRGDLVRGMANGLSTSQWISIAVVAGGLLGFILLFIKEKKNAQNLQTVSEDSSDSGSVSSPDDPKAFAEITDTESQATNTEIADNNNSEPSCDHE